MCVITLAAVLLSLLPSQSPAELMYTQGGLLFRTYDPVTGELLASQYKPDVVGARSLVYEDGRLITLSQNFGVQRDYLVEVAPATLRSEIIGMTGYSLESGHASLVRDPTTRRYFAQFNESFWEVNRETGEITFLSRIEPFEAFITAIAINSRGEVYGYSLPWQGNSKPAFYRVDLETGRTAKIGDLVGNPLVFMTLAFDSQDNLWGAGFGPFSFQKYRLYKIDLDEFTLSSPFPIDIGIQGIAFGPAPDVEAYCEAKLNSAGCAPSILWQGHPSATASHGFNVKARDVVNQAPGFLLLGLGGRASLPFDGGTLCVAAPLLRTTPSSSGGSPSDTIDCSGSWTLDVNHWLSLHHPLEPGAAFTCQWWGRDPGQADPNASQLSDALEVVLFP